MLESLEAIEQPLESPSVSSTGIEDVDMFFRDMWSSDQGVNHDGVVVNQGFMGDLWNIDDLINNFDLNETTESMSVKWFDA